MRVLFVYPNSTKSRETPLGIAYLAGTLKEHDYKTGLLDLTWDPSLDSIVRTMKGYDLLAISCGTLEYEIAVNIARIWKQHYGLPVVMGGPHPTVAPEEVIKDANVDAVGIGECEEAFLEFVAKYEVYDMIPTNVKNFWVKRDNHVYQNPLRPLAQNLDALPFPDRSIFDKRHIENHYPGASFLTARGCPFRCSMCINFYLQELFKGLGKYTRYRSVDNLIEEIKMVLASYDIKCILFSDDTFTLNHKRLYEFLDRYEREIAMPFVIMGRCNTVTKRLLMKLRKAGCIQVAYGVESGNDFIRNKVLKRHMTSQQIVNAFKWTRQAGITAVSFNMIGIPYEDRDKIFDTVRLNREINPALVQTTLMYPFPKTEICDLASRRGLINNTEQLTDYYADTIIRLPSITNKELHGLGLVFPFYIHMPKLFYPLIRLVEGLLSILANRRLGKVFTFGLRVFIRKFMERRPWLQTR